MRRYEQIIAMKNKGMSISDIANRMGKRESSVRIVLMRYGTPELHDAYKASCRTPEARAKAAARRKAKAERLGIEPWGWPHEFVASVVNKRRDKQSYRSIAAELKVSVGVISGIIHRHGKQMENA